MPVTHRALVFSTFLLSCVSLVFLCIGTATQYWVIGTDIRSDTDILYYGLFQGKYTFRVISEREIEIYQTCILKENICAYSCRGNSEMRKEEVMSFYNKTYLKISCGDLAVDDSPPAIEGEVSWYNGGVYVSTLVFLGLALIFTIMSALQGIYNTNRTPIEPVWGILGLYIWNGCASVGALVAIIIWGVHFDSNLQGKMAIIAIMFDPLHSPVTARIGYSYWVLLGSVICPLISMGLLGLRAYFIRTQPPPPKISIEHTDNTIFLY